MSSLLSYIYKQLRFSYLGNNDKIKQILIKSSDQKNSNTSKSELFEIMKSTSFKDNNDNYMYLYYF